MPTKEEKRDYAREYYQHNLSRPRKPSKSKKPSYLLSRELDLNLSKELGAKITFRKKQNSLKERKRQEFITKIWRETGEFRLPEDQVIEDEIIKEELLYVDTIEDVELEDCIEEEIYTDYEREQLDKNNE